MEVFAQLGWQLWRGEGGDEDLLSLMLLVADRLGRADPGSTGCALELLLIHAGADTSQGLLGFFCDLQPSSGPGTGCTAPGTGKKHLGVYSEEGPGGFNGLTQGVWPCSPS